MTERTASQERKRRSYFFGLIAEWMAAGLLMLKGYRPIAWRERTSAGEVDLIVQRGKTLVFVEVKARVSQRAAAESIQPRQRARLTRAAAAFMQKHPRYTKLSPRFDAVLVSPGEFPVHIENAWGAE